MWEGSYGKEPFDLRLTVLRLLRGLGKIMAVTLIGTILFGGIYYVKNVLLAKEQYTATVTCKVEYTDPPTKAGDYYINYATWETYVHSEEFLQMLIAAGDLWYIESWPEDLLGGLREMITADVPSDIQVPTFTVLCDSEHRAGLLERAVAETVTGPWADRLPEVASIEVIDMGEVHRAVDEFVRPVRAFVFGGVITCFFAVVLFLLREISADSIWLPVTLRTRYGLMTLGTVQSRELAENVRYAFTEKNGLLKKIAVCTVDDGMNPNEVLGVLRGKGILGDGQEGVSQEWIPVPSPVVSPETAKALREMDGVLLAVPAGLHTGKPLEHTMEFLREQDIRITGAILWEADEWLIRSYYLLQKPESGAPRGGVSGNDASESGASRGGVSGNDASESGVSGGGKNG